jgi:hypothetical protein
MILRSRPRTPKDLGALVVFGREWREGIYLVLPMHSEVRDKEVAA